MRKLSLIEKIEKFKSNSASPPETVRVTPPSIGEEESSVVYSSVDDILCLLKNRAELSRRPVEAGSGESMSVVLEEIRRSGTSIELVTGEDEEDPGEIINRIKLKLFNKNNSNNLNLIQFNSINLKIKKCHKIVKIQIISIPPPHPTIDSHTQCSVSVTESQSQTMRNNLSVSSEIGCLYTPPRVERITTLERGQRSVFLDTGWRERLEDERILIKNSIWRNILE
jgi:hypothetical protein